MIYRIEYGPPCPRRREKFPLRLVGLTCGFFLLFLMGVRIFCPEMPEQLTQLLLPAPNAGNFQDAVASFVTQLKSGVSFYDSLTAFCREIVSYADLPAV